MVITATARTVGTLMYWTGALSLTIASLGLLSMNLGWAGVSISALPPMERAWWVMFGAGGAVFACGMMIDTIAKIRDRAMGGPL